MAGHRTPNGTGHIFRKVRGWVESTLYPGAFMLDPMFFFPDRPGIALHGSVSNDLVEPYPASHACVRVWRPDVRKIFNESPLGTKVKVYGRY
jgi:lipoprotein-anchoring transpeptidase ErfK/SrfK